MQSSPFLLFLPGTSLSRYHGSSSRQDYTIPKRIGKIFSLYFTEPHHDAGVVVVVYIFDCERESISLHGIEKSNVQVVPTCVS